MGELTFKGLKVDELDLTNKIEGQVELDISQRASFNVKYSNDNLHCMANLTIDMMEKTHPMDFNFKISATALFDCEEGMDKKEIHKKAYDEIYPHVRALVITFMVNSGLPPTSFSSIYYILICGGVGVIVYFFKINIQQ